MDRREFLKIAAALPAVAYLPEAAGEQPITATEIKLAVERMQGYSMGPWYCFLHPEQETALRDIAAKERWRYAYKHWRKDGRPPLTCQGILDKYTPIHDWEFPARPEIGTYESVRFITMESV